MFKPWSANPQSLLEKLHPTTGFGDAVNVSESAEVEHALYDDNGDAEKHENTLEDIRPDDRLDATLKKQWS